MNFELPQAKKLLAYLTEAIVVLGLKKVPVLGDLIDIKERLKIANILQKLLARYDSLEQRYQVLENLAAIPAVEAEAICRPHLRGSADQQQYASEMVQQIRQRITRKLSSTSHIGTARGQEDASFYVDLIPERRPHDYAGQVVPHHPRWVLQELLGSGGMGEVWRAQHETLPEQEAIKFCHDEQQRSFLQREVDTLKLVQQLPQHPNLVRLKDVNLDHAPYWLAFEYVDGGTLQDLLQQRHLAWGEVLQVMEAIVQGVAAAHTLGVVHRDLKPANILLTVKGIPKVTDFGLGKVLAVGGISPMSTRVGMGTAGYAAPEQVNGLKADPADDVYALGIILWQLATHSVTPPQYLRQSLAASYLPQTVQALILDCVESPRGVRPADANVLWQRLRQLPLSLGNEQELTQLRQQADATRTVAQQTQAAQFATQLQAQVQQALQLQQQQAARLQQVPQFTIATVADGSKGQFAEQWEKLKRLQAEVGTITTTFAKEQQAEQQRVEQLLAAAMVQLGEFTSAPRDEEFEFLAEYQERVAQERAQYDSQQQAIRDLWQRTLQDNLALLTAAKQARLTPITHAIQAICTVRQPLQCGDLTAWNYNVDQGVLQCQGLVRGILPLQQLHLYLVTKMPRESAKYYRTAPQLFVLYGQLALQADAATIVVLDSYMEVVGQGRFATTVEVVVEDELAAFKQAMDAGTEAALVDFIQKYPRATQMPDAQLKLAEVRQRIHSDAFDQAMAANTASALEDFIHKYPQATQVEAARVRLADFPKVEYIHGWSTAAVQDLQARTAKALRLPVAYQHDLKSGGKGPVMVVIPAGEFLLGSPEDEPERDGYREKQQRVTIAKPLAMGKFAVSRGEFELFVQATGYKTTGEKAGGFTKYNLLGKKLVLVLDAGKNWRDPGLAQDNTHPVVGVSWHDMVAYCVWLSAQTGKHYRLPSEAEWEYAARAGTTTAFFWGNSITPEQASYSGNEVYKGGGAKGVTRGKTVPVDEFTPNAWGLYQMHGNVWEWTGSLYANTYTGTGEELQSHTQADDDQYLATRGGAWYFSPSRVRSAMRNISKSIDRNNYTGGRVVQD